MRCSAQRAYKAFSLFEMLCVLAMIALLLLWAIPYYQASVVRATQLRVQTTLLSQAQWLSQRYQQFGRYDQNHLGMSTRLPILTVDAGAVVQYRLQVSFDAAGQQFELRAIPEGRLSTDRCGAFVVNSTGETSNQALPLTRDFHAQGCWQF